jgi:hypothetical protein
MDWSPDFIGIGAEKSATTWAWTILNEHPAVGMSQPKELNYFNQHSDRSIDWYRQFFRYNPLSQKCGEISPQYMDDPKVAARMAAQFPDVRVLVMLRDPFDRAMSHLFHDAHKMLGGVSTATAADLQQLARQDERYLRRSLYGRALQPFFDLFPASQIGVFFFEDVKQHSEQLARSLYDFVGVDTDFIPLQLNEKVNESTDWYSARLARLAIRTSQTAKAFPPTRMVMEWIYRHTQLRERAISMLSVRRGRPVIQFHDVFTDHDRDTILEDLQQLNTLLPNGLPSFWTPPSGDVLSPFAPIREAAAA